MRESDIYEVLKNLSLADVISIVIKEIGINNTTTQRKDIYYTAKQLIEIYPNIFSKYKIDKYIKYNNFPVIKEGKERFFLKSSVEQWLENQKNQAIFRRMQ